MILFILQVIFIIFVVVKAVVELCRNNQFALNKNPVYGSYTHSNQHMVFIIAIVIYQVSNLFTYLMFISHYEYKASEDFLLWIKISFLNIIFLLFINHFKQERLNKTETFKLMDIFKF